MSSNPSSSSGFLVFGPFRVDPKARLFFRGDEEIPLAPKAFDLLLFLAGNAGRAVPREEILRAVWAGVAVSDGTLTQAVFVLRRALGEGEEGSRIVATVPRVGYRFTPEVRTVPFAADAPSPTEAPREAPEGPARPIAPTRGISGAVVAVVAAVGVVSVAAILAFLSLSVAPGGWRPGRSGTRPAERPVPSGGRAEAGGGPLLELVRQIPVPPDASVLLGLSGGTAVLGAPTALYLVPVDGAQPATRVPLAPSEVVARPASRGELLVLKERGLVMRDAVSQKERALGSLPAGVGPPREGGLLLSPSGRRAAVREERGVAVLSLDGESVRLLFRVAAPASPNEALALSDRWLAFAPGGGEPIRAWSLETGEKVLEAPLPETRLGALAVEDASGRLVAGGAFDGLYSFTIGAGRAASGAAGEALPSRGWTRALAIVADHPTVVASGRLGLSASRPGAGEVGLLASLESGGPLLATPGGLLVLLPERQRLALVRYRGFAPLSATPLSNAPLWAVEHDASGGSLFAAGRDGRLYVVDAASGLLRRTVAAHADGIPSMLREGDLLATSSDDKTVAVWRLPGPALERRTRAHDFLVNDLRVSPRAPGGALLATTSSDGTLKTWRWPILAPIDAVPLAPIAGRSVEAHALWAAPGGERVLVGTWNHRLLDLSFAAGRWSGRALAVEPSAVYRLAQLPRLSLVAGVGLSPHGVFLYDLGTGRLAPLPDGGLDVYWLVADEERDELWVAGSGGLSRYAISREGTGLRVRLWSRRQTGLDLLTLCRTPSGALWGGTDDGVLVRLDPAALDGPALADAPVVFGSSRG